MGVLAINTQNLDSIHEKLASKQEFLYRCTRNSQIGQKHPCIEGENVIELGESVVCDQT